MTLTITIDLGNAAFADDGVSEVERILIDVASRLPSPLDQTGGEYMIHDYNGNHCGSFQIREEGGAE